MAQTEKCRHCGGGAVDLMEHEQNCVMRPEASAPSCSGHERIYEDGAGYICRHCGADLSDDDEEV
jgi:ribosomal protein L40E